MRLLYYNIVLLFLLDPVDSNNTDRFNYRETVGDDFGPDDWDQVTCDGPGQCLGWPDGWEIAIGWELSKNKCYSCPASSSSQCELHQQSPIDLKRAPSITGHDNVCYDYHWMAYQDGSCNWHDMIKNGYTTKENQFQIQRHALQILQPVDEEGVLQCPNADGARNFPRLDYSKGFPDWWFLRHTEVTVPSEHTQEGRRYDAEVHLAHFYSVDFPEDERKIGKVAIFLQADENSPRWDFLDKLLCQWREVEEQTRNACGLPSISKDYPGCRNPRRQVRQEPLKPDPYPFVDCDSVGNSQRICKPSSCCEAERSTSRYCQNDVYDAFGDELTGSICWWCCPGKLLAPRDGSSPLALTNPPTSLPTPFPTEEPRHQDPPPQSDMQNDPIYNPLPFLSFGPSSMPSGLPTVAPTTVAPTTVPPSLEPSARPSIAPSVQPSKVPSIQPSSKPSFKPSNNEKPSPAPSPPSAVTVAPVIVLPPSTKVGPETEAPSIQLKDQKYKGLQRWYRLPQKQKPTATPTCMTTSAAPIITPSVAPSVAPSIEPSIEASIEPSSSPTNNTDAPSITSSSPSLYPSTVPTPISKFATDSSNTPTAASIIPTPAPAISTWAPTTLQPSPGPAALVTPEPTTSSSISGSFVFDFTHAPTTTGQLQEAPPKITCSDYRNNTKINFDRICRDDDGCCESDQRSASNGCHYAYNFFGEPLMASVCRDCCNPSKQVAPAPPRHPVYPPLDCSFVQNPFRLCKANSCCDATESGMTDYCEANYEEHGFLKMGSICWYCCSQPKELNPDKWMNHILSSSSKAGPVVTNTSINSTIWYGRRRTTSTMNDKDEGEEDNTTNTTTAAAPEEDEDVATTTTATQQQQHGIARLKDEWGGDIVMDPSNFRVTEHLEQDYLADITEYRQRKEQQKQHRRQLEDDDNVHGNNYHDVKYSPYEWMREVRTEYYYRYEGSQMVPPCFETVHYRVMKDPIRIHPRQLEELERLLAQRIDPDTCENDTAGRPRSNDAPGKVDLNRPLQAYSNIHRKVFCECQDWDSKWKEDQDWCEMQQEERFYEKPYNFS